MAWDEELFPEQRHAAGVDAGDYLVLAGPGTGKTFVMVRRIEFLIDELGVNPSEIQALTFSWAAAAEMRDRLVEQLGERGHRVRVSTLHSYALRQLMLKGARRLPAPVRVAGDWEERWIVVEELARLLGRKVGEISNGRDGALDLLADDWETLEADGDGWLEGHPDAKFIGMWQRHREVYGYSLRSELVYQLLVELRSDPALVPQAVQHIVVDEYQDLNRCDLDTVRLLSERVDAFLFAAGDDDQSIYSFRHAAPAGIRTFEEDYPDSATLVLTECRRCGEAIVAISNWLIEQEPHRVPKELVSVTEWDAQVRLLRFPNQQSEAAALARAIEAEIVGGTAPHEILILVKSDARGHVASALRGALESLGIDMYMPRGARIESDDLQRVLEYLILSAALKDGRIDDLALRALLELEQNGVGGRRIAAVTSRALERSIRFSAAIEELRNEGGTRLEVLFRAVDTILETASNLEPDDGERFDEWLTRVAERLALPDEAFEILVQISARVSEELVDLEMTEADGPEGASDEPFDYVSSLLDAMSNLSDAIPPQIEGRVTFTTMHGAKGLTCRCRIRSAM